MKQRLWNWQEVTVTARMMILIGHLWYLEKAENISKAEKGERLLSAEQMAGAYV